jgi:2-dehydropantoate 2-reductase
LRALPRGATLAALERHGWRLEEAGVVHRVPARAAADAATLGPQDVVIVCVKGPALPALAPRLLPLIGPATLVVPAMNGVPWWFGGVVPVLGDRPLESVDPGGAIAAALPLSQVVGCVVHVSAELAEPGFARHRSGHGLIVGEPGGGSSERVERLAALLAHAGFEATVSRQVMREIWYKLWGNMTANPVSAVTGATMEQILDDPLVRAFCAAAMREANAVGERIGCGLEQSPEDRQELARRLGPFRTSMLQDADAGRPLELDSIVGVVRDIGARVGVATPTIDALFGLARLYGRVHGLYPRAGG